MLSIADFLLAILWVVGGVFWLSGRSAQPNYDKDSCFAVLLATVVSEEEQWPLSAHKMATN